MNVGFRDNCFLDGSCFSRQIGLYLYLSGSAFVFADDIIETRSGSVKARINDD